MTPCTEISPTASPAAPSPLRDVAAAVFPNPMSV
jgi:hypothetical protein